MARIDELRGRLAELDELIGRGVLKANAVRADRERLETQVLSEVLRPGPGDRPARPSRRLLSGLAAFVVVAGVAGYAWRGNPQVLAPTPSAPFAADAASAPHAMATAQIEAMVQRLADRLQRNPDDADGWSTLGRSYAVLGRLRQALQAYRHAVELKPKEAQAYADYADALGMANKGKLDGEPEKIVAQALQLDPDNVKALALAGTIAFDRGDEATAADHWERALRNVEPGSETARRLQIVIAGARQGAGRPPLPATARTLARVQTAAPDVAATVPGLVAAPRASVRARIALAPALVAQAAPGDAVFIFARALSGPKAPLAIQRRQVKDLPLDVTLDDTMAMSPALRLSTVKRVVVGARISKSGNAMPQPGDLQGLSAAMAGAVGAGNAQVEIVDVLH
jgi:cytochrome c-type biogenesis protein CcmH